MAVATKRFESSLSNPPDPNDNFLSGNTANYIDEMYLQWKQDPKSVHISWQVYFKNMESGEMPISQAFQPPPSLIPGSSVVPGLAAGAGVGIGEGANVTNHLKVQLLVRAYQARGHHKAKIDPLGIRNTSKGFGNIKPKELSLEYYQFTEKDLDTEYTLGPGILPRFKNDGREKMTLREIVAACEKIYCGAYGVEFIHIPDREKCDWLRERLEVPQPFKYSIDEKRRILDRLIWSSSFESFLATKYPNDKRFGLEGCETLVPGMKALIDRSVDYGVKDIVIGMPHRGRLNVLSNVVRKPNESIFSEFAGTSGAEDEGSGDVKYHLGMNFERPTPSGKRVQLSLVANPSHLEAEDPVVSARFALFSITTTTRRPTAVPWPSCSTATPPSPPKASSTNVSDSTLSRLSPPAALCTWLSTTKSASPPIPVSPARLPTAPTSPRPSMPPCSTSTPTMWRLSTLSANWLPTGVLSSSRMLLSTWCATASTATTRLTSLPSPSL